MRTGTRTASAVALLPAVAALPTSATAAAADTSHLEGQLPSGAPYMMDVPADWNGTVLLFSHGYDAGHSTFSPAEQLAALHTLEDRLGTRTWQGTDVDSLNARAAAADSTTPARYVSYRPTPYLRPYDLAHPADGR